jgi:alpha-tubulin suppressor-like RCC1 family protein
MSCHARLAAALVIACALAVGATTPPSARAAVAAPGGLDVGRFHACALVAATSVRCWGYGGDGALGYGNLATIGDDETPIAAGPVDFGAGRSARMVATGATHSCAVLDDGSVRCWGFGGDGRLGYGNQVSIGDDETPASAGPVNIGPGRTAISIAAGRAHTCAILDDGSVRCWGYGGPFDGRLGYGNTDSIGDTEPPAAAGPVKLGAGRTATALALGDSHTCALLDDGTVRCWGFAGFGELGYGDTNTFSTAQTPDTVGTVQLGGTAVAITAGNFHTCALLAGGAVRCWGYGGDGELGYGSTSNVGDDEVPAIVGPVDLGPGRTAVAIDAGGDFTCALLDDGTVRCWGDGSNGRLGYGATANIGDDETPGSVGPIDLGGTAVAIAAGWTSACARLGDGAIRCWGAGLAGALGDCRVDDVGDNESPATLGPIALGEPGIAETGCPPPISALGLTPQPGPAASRPAAPDDGIAAQRARAAALRACRTGVSRRAAVQRRHARALPVATRAAAVRRIDDRARRARRACVRRYARRPGAVTALTARATGRHTIVLGFRATGSDAIKPPAARGYVVKQSTRPIRTARDVRRAHALCHGTCRFAVDEVGRRISLKVTDLTARRTFYYVVMARDNVTGTTGPRSRTVRARTR